MLIKISDFFKVSTDYILGIKDNRTLNIDNLTEKQIAHIEFIIEDLRVNNKK